MRAHWYRQPAALSRSAAASVPSREPAASAAERSTMARAIGLPAAHRRARPIRTTAAGSPASTAASAHSAAYQGRQSPLYQARKSSGGVASRVTASAGRPAWSSTSASKNSP